MTGIAEFYSGQNVLVTGATGFMGKMLVEKLLRSCPDVGNIYILLRSKKGRPPCERVSTILDNPLYDVLRQQNPENFKKIVPISGDCTELNLGLSPSDRKLLEENVSAVFHLAASVRFNDPLKKAVIMNTRGTREIMMLARNMKHLKILVHTSTTYCNCDKKEVDEIVYPPHASWKEIIEIAETIDEHTLNALTPKIMGNLPNTYTFTKSLAEHVVKDLGEGLPIVIFRPSIVVSSLHEPFAGWVDNFNGPVGLMVGGGKGVLRISYTDPNILGDYMPVDLSIRFMLIASWLKAQSGDISEPAVYNCSQCNLNTITYKELVELGFQCTKKIPFNDVIWLPGGTVTKHFYLYYLGVIFLHLIPGIMFDTILRLSGRKPVLVRLHRKIYEANMAISYFLTNSWTFKNAKLLSLSSYLLPQDKADFDIVDFNSVIPMEYFLNATKGGRKYLMHEDDDSLPRARKHVQRLYWIDRIARVLVILFFSWVLYKSMKYRVSTVY